jgi:hypothetical protein
VPSSHVLIPTHLAFHRYLANVSGISVGMDEVGITEIQFLAQQMFLNYKTNLKGQMWLCAPIPELRGKQREKDGGFRPTQAIS